MRPDETVIRELKGHGARAVRLLQRADGSTHTVKSWVLTPWFITKCLMGIAQPWRHWRGSRRLQRAGLPTPPVESIRIGWLHGRPVLLLSMPFIEGRTALERLQGETEPDDARVAEALGRMVVTLAEAGLRHRDFKLSNVVLESPGDTVWLIDPVGVVRCRDRVHAMACMLDRLEIEGRSGLVALPVALRLAVSRTALRLVDRPTRQAVLQQLRAHRRR
ncbi:MAG: hypothetical protein MK116_01550 [Phycisphaerales bacterium]|nr:hypothetical protein [Phycisphaerales bacterium]